MDDQVQALPIAGDVLELACGPARWTPLLAGAARRTSGL
jgi:hypothetical protein